MSPNKRSRKPKTGLHLLRSLFPSPAFHFTCSAGCGRARSPPSDDAVFHPLPLPLRLRSKSPFPYYENDVVSSPTFSLNLHNNNTMTSTMMMAPPSPHPPPTGYEEYPNGRATPRRPSTCSTSSSSKLGESVAAVVKESNDPYLDFRHSMLQMIFEKEIFLMEDLQELLACFLRLNLPCHHDSIIRAFSEIWGTVMSPSPHPIPDPKFRVQ